MIDVEQLAPGLGVRDDHGMRRDRLFPICVLAHFRRAERVLIGLRSGDLAVRVQGAQARQQFLHAVREGLVGEVLVGEDGVAAERRHVEGVENGAHRRLGHHRRIGVPFLADDFLVAGFSPDLHDLGIGLRALVVGVDENLAEPARERFVLGYVQRLIAKEDHAMIEQRAANVADRAVVEGLRNVDAVHLGSDGAGNRAHLDS